MIWPKKHPSFVRFWLIGEAFMKELFLVIMMLSLASCMPAITIAPDESMVTVSPTQKPSLTTPTPKPSLTATIEKSISEPMEFPTASAMSPMSASTLDTFTPLPTDAGCFDLLEPVNGAIFLNVGQVDFAWEHQDGAQFYVLFLFYPGSRQEQFRTELTEWRLAISSTTKSDPISWYVTAYDSKGDPICSSLTYFFYKPQDQKTIQQSGPVTVIPPIDVPPACPVEPPTSTPELGN